MTQIKLGSTPYATPSREHKGQGNFANAGSFCGHQVTVAAVPFDHRIRKEESSGVASVVFFAAGATVATWQDVGGRMGLDFRGDTSQAFAALAVVSIGGMAGYVLKRAIVGVGNAVSRGYDWYCGKRDRLSPQTQLARIVDHAVAAGPLTLAGIYTAVARIRELQARCPQITRREIAFAMADLAGAVPIGTASCLRPDKISSYLDTLADGILRSVSDEVDAANAEDAILNRDALVRLAHQLRATGEPTGIDLAQVLFALTSALPIADGGDDDLELATFGLELNAGWFAALQQAPLLRDRPVIQAAGQVSLRDGKTYVPVELQPFTHNINEKSLGLVGAEKYIADLLAGASLGTLRKEVAAALHIVKTQTHDPIEKAERYLAIFDALDKRELIPCMFIMGLLSHETVKALMDKVASSTATAQKKMELIEKLPRLSQMNGDVELGIYAARLINRLRQPGQPVATRVQPVRLSSFTRWLQNVTRPATVQPSEENIVRVHVMDMKAIDGKR